MEEALCALHTAGGEHLVDGMQRAGDGEVVLELNGHLLPNESREEAVEQHLSRATSA